LSLFIIIFEFSIETRNFHSLFFCFSGLTDVGTGVGGGAGCDVGIGDISDTTLEKVIFVYKI